MLIKHLRLLIIRPAQSNRKSSIHRQHIFTFSILIAFSCCTESTSAKQRVAKYTEPIQWSGISWQGTFQNAVVNKGVVIPNGLNQLEEARNRDTCFVYQDMEVDKIQNDITNEMRTGFQSIRTQIGVSADETKSLLRSELKDSIDKLPLRLVVEEARKSLKGEILSDLKEENAKLRADITNLQERLDKVEKRR